MKHTQQASARPNFLFKPTLAALAVATCFLQAGVVLANPTGAQVAAGNAQFATNGNTLSVTNAPGTIINWQQFGINANETTRFLQQSANSAVLNRVVGNNPSQIYGTLQSNGQVYLINQNGILIGPNAMIDVNKLVASTLNLTDANFLNKNFTFSGGGYGQLLNQGKISTPLGGSVYLIGSDVRNEGIITSPQGTVVLAAGNTVSMADSAGPELSVTVTANGNKAVNLGTITAAGGQINMFGALIEQQGILSADSASVDAQGRIILKASDSTTVSGTINANNSAGKGGEIQVLGNNVTLTSTANLDASGATGGGTVLVGGDWQGSNTNIQNASNTTMQAGATIKADATQNGDGGKVVLWANNTADFKGAIFARGGEFGGNGGQVETSGHEQLLIGGTVNTLATKGLSGTWLIDPAKICILPTAGSCVWVNDPLAYMATVYTPADIDLALSTNGSLSLQATDYFAFMPNGGTYTVGASTPVPGGGKLTITTPYFYSNGVFDARTNQVNLKLWIEAFGTSPTFNGANGVYLDAGTKILLPGSGLPKRQKDNRWNTADFRVNTTSGGEFSMRSGALIDIGDPLNYSGVALISASYLVNPDAVGGIVKAGIVDFQVDSISGPPTQIDAWSLYLAPYSKTQMLLGTDSCAISAFCLSDMAMKFVGSWKETQIGSWANNSASIEIVGPFNPRSQNLSIEALGNVFVSSPLSVAGELYIWSSNGNVYINAPVQASYVWIDTEKAGYIELTSTVTGTGNLPPMIIPGDPEIYRPTAYDPTVILTLANNENAYLGPIGQLQNLYGPTAINGTNGKTWFIAVPGSRSFDITGLAGVDYRYYANLSAILAAGYLKYSTLLGDGLQFYVVGALPPKIETSRETDPCVLNPIFCKATVTDPNGAPITKAYNPKLNGPLTIAAELTADDRYIARNDSANPQAVTAILTQTSILAKLDIDKTFGEVKEEARKARKDSEELEAEAKQAEKEAKQAEAEAKVAKTPEQRANAQRRAASKRSEAVVKKAQAEARRAESESREALADNKQIVSDSKTAAPAVAATRRAEAESRQIRAEERRAEAQAKQATAEGKQADSRAKQADADAKKAEAEVRTAKTPEQKLAAIQKAEVKKTEAQAHKAEGEARKSEAEGKQVEAQAKKAEGEAKKAEGEARLAKTPQQKANAEKRADAKKSEADVKKTEAEAKHIEAEGKQARADAKYAEADAKASRSPGGRVVNEKRADAKKAEGEQKQAEAATKKAEAGEKKARAEEKQARDEAKGEKNAQKKAEAEKKADSKKAETEQKQAEVKQKKAEAEQKKVEAENKAEEHRVAEGKRSETRRAESAKAFGQVAAGTSKEGMAAIVGLRHELKTEALQPALSVLERNPAAADLPPCAGSAILCVPEGMQGFSPLPAPLMPTVSFLPQIQRKIALVVGVNKYNDPAIPALETALPDAQAVGKQLQDQFGYETRVVANGSRLDIVSSLNRLAREVGPNDSVTIYYAGHGYLNEKTNAGYWIPGDAKASAPDNWLSNKDITKLLNNIPAKQVMLVSDSCYSGALTKEQWVTGSSKSDPNTILAKRSVTVMSSGGEEPVSDEGKDGHSIFAYSFMNALKSIKQYESAGKVFESVKADVTREYPQQPQYGGAMSAGHAPGADYLFEARSFK